MPQSRKLLEELRALPEKKNEFRVAALAKQRISREGEGAPAAKLKRAIRISPLAIPRWPSRPGSSLKEIK